MAVASTSSPASTAGHSITPLLVVISIEPLCRARREEPHAPTAAGALEHVYGEHPAEQVGPRDPPPAAFGARRTPALSTWLQRLRCGSAASSERAAEHGVGPVVDALVAQARGVLLVGLLAILVDAVDVAGRDWWAGARLRPFSEQVAEGILYYADLGSRYFEGG